MVNWRIKANSNTGYSHAGLINNSALEKLLQIIGLIKFTLKKRDMLIEMRLSYS